MKRPSLQKFFFIFVIPLCKAIFLEISIELMNNSIEQTPCISVTQRDPNNNSQTINCRNQYYYSFSGYYNSVEGFYFEMRTETVLRTTYVTYLNGYVLVDGYKFKIKAGNTFYSTTN